MKYFRPLKVLVIALWFVVVVAASSQASPIVSWHFDPSEHHMSTGEEIHLTAILLNDPASTENLVAADVLDGSGVNWLPGQNLFQEGLNVEFVFNDVAGVVLSPGEALGFIWGIVTNWKDVSPGEYTIDFASINGHNTPDAIVSSNVFTIVFVPEPSSAALLGLALGLMAVVTRARRPTRRCD